MPNLITTLGLITLLEISVLSLAGQPNKTSSKTTSELSEGLRTSNEFRLDSSVTYQNYIQKSNLLISENALIIAELKSRKQIGNIEAQRHFSNKVLVLEKINIELMFRLKESESINTTMWDTFISEFDRDMNELKKGLKYLTADEINQTEDLIRP